MIGRAGKLIKIRGMLEQGSRTAFGRTVGIAGLGGMGKTQLAVEYAHDHGHDYEGGVYWFQADQGLPETGKTDQATRDALQQAYGS